jgi:hypothetical protein
MLFISLLSTDSYISTSTEMMDEFDLGSVVGFEGAFVDLTETLAG